ncbi:MAG: HAMP domain-containing protein [Candidatus Rokubacteria bacterium]|nr:HAMP domain-containing protein [Candidatus Rokubacteria bacterium]
MTDAAPVAGSPFGGFLLRRTPLGRLVTQVARLRASVHQKLLAAFLLITLLFIVMGTLSLQSLAQISRQNVLMHEAHERVDWSLQAEKTFALQMNFTAMALLRRDEASIEHILRENNRFSETLSQIEQAAPPEERGIIQRIRAAQDRAVDTVADIANLVRDDRIDAARVLQLQTQYPLYQEIQGLIDQVVAAERARMDALRLAMESENRHAARSLALRGFGAVLLAVLLGFVISWSFILPVRQAHDFLGQVAKGDFSGRMTVPNRDEFGELAARMNQMSAELARLYEHQRQSAAELQALNHKLEAASRAKSEFLANMSHELRTPMNAILGFLEMMLDEIYGDVPEHFKEPLRDVQTNGKHLLRLINDVLDLSKIEAGRMELSLAEYSPRDVVDTVRASLQSLAAEKGLEFATSVAADVPAALGDGKRITQCVMNLAGNALKFTKDGRVDILVERDGESLIYRVRDTGLGIPQAQLGHIFEEFRQVDATITREYGGTGLGLTITKTFVEMHGGRIWVESEPGRGSTFSFSVPLRVREGQP